MSTVAVHLLTYLPMVVCAWGKKTAFQTRLWVEQSPVHEQKGP